MEYDELLSQGSEVDIDRFLSRDLEEEIRKVEERLQSKKQQLACRFKEKQEHIDLHKETFRDTQTELQDRIDELETELKQLQRRGYTPESDRSREEEIRDRLEKRRQELRQARMKRDERIESVEERYEDRAESLRDSIDELEERLRELEREKQVYQFLQ